MMMLKTAWDEVIEKKFVTVSENQESQWKLKKVL